MPPAKPACITIGNFDGVHLGHQFLINLARQIATNHSLEFYLLTFWPHPRTVLKGSGFHKPLASREEKMRLLASCGARNILELPFTTELSRLNAEEFIVRELLPHNLAELVVGHDFTLGREREGHVERLRELGARYGFHVSQAPPFALNGTIVSSTRLRGLIADCEVAGAARLLGRFYSVGGRIGHGFGRGTGLGYPTANLVDPDALLPGVGVYATFAHCAGKRYEAVTNIGTNPTFGNTSVSVETFFLDTDADLYNQQLRLEFVALLRHERKFDSPGALAAQIGQDVGQARLILNAPAC